MDKISPIKERILHFIEFKGITKDSFCKNTGISYANLRGKSLFSEIGGSQIAEILSVYGEISPNWLITGNGDMLKNSPNIVQSASSPAQPDQSPGAGCPLCKDKDERIKDLQKSIEMWETNFKSLSTNFQTIVQSYISDKQYLKDQIDDLQQQHFDTDDTITSQAG